MADHSGWPEEADPKVAIVEVRVERQAGGKLWISPMHVFFGAKLLEFKSGCAQDDKIRAAQDFRSSKRGFIPWQESNLKMAQSVSRSKPSSSKQKRWTLKLYPIFYLSLNDILIFLFLLSQCPMLFFLKPHDIYFTKFFFKSLEEGLKGRSHAWTFSRETQAKAKNSIIREIKSRRTKKLKLLENEPVLMFIYQGIATSCTVEAILFFLIMVLSHVVLHDEIFFNEAVFRVWQAWPLVLSVPDGQAWGREIERIKERRGRSRCLWTRLIISMKKKNRERVKAAVIMTRPKTSHVCPN